MHGVGNSTHHAGANLIREESGTGKDPAGSEFEDLPGEGRGQPYRVREGTSGDMTQKSVVVAKPSDRNPPSGLSDCSISRRHSLTSEFPSLEPRKKHPLLDLPMLRQHTGRDREDKGPRRPAEQTTR